MAATSNIDSMKMTWNGIPQTPNGITKMIEVRISWNTSKIELLINTWIDRYFTVTTSQWYPRRHSTTTINQQNMESPRKSTTHHRSFCALLGQKTDQPLAIMLEKAGYDFHSQYAALLFYYQHIIHHLGPPPTPQGSPYSWQSYATDDYSRSNTAGLEHPHPLHT